LLAIKVLLVVVLLQQGQIYHHVLEAILLWVGEQLVEMGLEQLLMLGLLVEDLVREDLEVLMPPPPSPMWAGLALAV
jgi:hypothetical protein